MAPPHRNIKRPPLMSLQDDAMGDNQLRQSVEENNSQEPPPGYVSTTEAEDLAIEVALNFSSHFLGIYPLRRAPFLVALNECGVARPVTQTVSPFRISSICGASCASFAEIVQFFSDFLIQSPLENPTEYPSTLQSPGCTLSKQSGTSFDLATAAVSALLGSGYRAFVVVGYASRRLTDTITDCMNAPPYRVDFSAVGDPIEALCDDDVSFNFYMQMTDEAKEKVTTSIPAKADEPLPEQQDDNEDSQGNAADESVVAVAIQAIKSASQLAIGAIEKLPSPDTSPIVESQFYVPARDIPTISRYDRYKEVEAQRIGRGEDDMLVYMERASALRNPPPPPQTSDLLEEDEDDPLYGQRLHAWVLVTKGPGQSLDQYQVGAQLELGSGCFLWDVASGIVIGINGAITPTFPTQPRGSPPRLSDYFFGIEAIFSHRNLFVCTQPFVDGMTSLDTELFGPGWEPLFTSPQCEEIRRRIILRRDQKNLRMNSTQLSSLISNRVAVASVAQQVSEAFAIPRPPTEEAVAISGAVGTIAAAVAEATRDTDSIFPREETTYQEQPSDGDPDQTSQDADVLFAPLPWPQRPSVPSLRVHLRYPGGVRRYEYQDLVMETRSPYQVAGIERFVCYRTVRQTRRICDDAGFVRAEPIDTVHFNCVEKFSGRSDRLVLRYSSWEASVDELRDNELPPLPDTITGSWPPVWPFKAVCLRSRELFTTGRDDGVAIAYKEYNQGVESLTKFSAYPLSRSDGLVEMGVRDDAHLWFVYGGRPDRLVKLEVDIDTNAAGDLPEVQFNGTSTQIVTMKEIFCAPHESVKSTLGLLSAQLSAAGPDAGRSGVSATLDVHSTAIGGVQPTDFSTQDAFVPVGDEVNTVTYSLVAGSIDLVDHLISGELFPRHRIIKRESTAPESVGPRRPALSSLSAPKHKLVTYVAPTLPSIPTVGHSVVGADVAQAYRSRELSVLRSARACIALLGELRTRISFMHLYRECVSPIRINGLGVQELADVAINFLDSGADDVVNAICAADNESSASDYVLSWVMAPYEIGKLIEWGVLERPKKSAAVIDEAPQSMPYMFTTGQIVEPMVPVDGRLVFTREQADAIISDQLEAFEQREKMHAGVIQTRINDINAKLHSLQLMAARRAQSGIGKLSDDQDNYNQLLFSLTIASSRLKSFNEGREIRKQAFVTQLLADERLILKTN